MLDLVIEIMKTNEILKEYILSMPIFPAYKEFLFKIFPSNETEYEPLIIKKVTKKLKF